MTAPVDPPLTGDLRRGPAPAADFPPDGAVGAMVGAMVGAALLFIGLCLLMRDFVADDAYIVGRYAANAAAGLGLVYNPGEQVSALTSPLHALLASALAWLGLDPVAGYRAIAPVFVLGGGWAAIRAGRLGGRSLALFVVLTLGSPFLALWTVGGLETPLLAGLATLFFARLVAIARAGAVGAGDFAVLGLLAGLMFVTRHDSVLVSAPLLVALLVLFYRRLALWAGAALCLGVVAGWLGFAAWYYGDIFPTSYYVKLAVAGRAPVDSLSALLNFGVLSGLAGLGLLARRVPATDLAALARALRRGAAASAALFVIYASQAAGQHMMFGFRLFMPYLMGAALVLVLRLGDPGRALLAAVAVLQAIMVAVVLWLGVNPAPLARLPGLDRAYAEYEFITPRTYGRFMTMLREDAAAIAAHWAATGRDDQPRIYLRTGGTGYWLPGFYVYETLVSYRHGCGERPDQWIDAAHYLQQLGFSRMGTLVEDRGRARPDIADDAPLMFATTLDWMGPQVTGYLFGPAPATLTLGPRVGAGC